MTIQNNNPIGADVFDPATPIGKTFAEMREGLRAEWQIEFITKLDPSFTVEDRENACRLFVAIAVAACFASDDLGMNDYHAIVEAIRHYPDGYGCALGFVGSTIAAMTFASPELTAEVSANCRWRTLGAYRMAEAILGDLSVTKRERALKNDREGIAQ